jgi:NAD(P)-dependent dehydrogenase (short-subunit alcohol dehydrogenase family)
MRAGNGDRPVVTALPQPFSLVGRVALITGAGGLLGPEHAAALLETGSRVVLTDVDDGRLVAVARPLVAQYGQDRVITRVMDVTHRASILSVRDGLPTPVDILVNNAAIDAKVGSDGGARLTRLEHFSLDAWNLELGVGLTGALLCIQVFGAAMAERRRGVILNIASDLAVISPDQRLYRKEGLRPEAQPAKPVTYSVIKSGLVGLTRYVATYWADCGVRANALSPGGVIAGQDEIFVTRLTSLIPMGRMAAREEYRSAIQFLCSDASGYMTGQNVVMDGGRTVW